jgi:hypothetical protein
MGLSAAVALRDACIWEPTCRLEAGGGERLGVELLAGELVHQLAVVPAAQDGEPLAARAMDDQAEDRTVRPIRVELPRRVDDFALHVGSSVRGKVHAEHEASAVVEPVPLDRARVEDRRVAELHGEARGPVTREGEGSARGADLDERRVAGRSDRTVARNGLGRRLEDLRVGLSHRQCLLPIFEHINGHLHVRHFLRSGFFGLRHRLSREGTGQHEEQGGDEMSHP